MVRIWYMRDPVTDQFSENFNKDPPEYLTAEQLKLRTRVTCHQVEVNEARQDEILNAVTEIKQCNYRDVIDVSPDKMGDQFDAKLKIFFHEHLHADDEVRFILDGTGYFDVRDAADDRWIRIAVEQGDLLDLPAGIYHRFTTDEKRYLRAMRLFVGAPVWTPHNRDENGDEEPARKYYLEHFTESGSLWNLTNGANSSKKP